MLVLHCTRKLLRRTGSSPTPSALPSTTRLGGFTANILITRRQQVVLAVSNVTLLPVLLPAAPAVTLLERLPSAIAEMLRALGVAERAVLSEVREMASCVVTATNDRRVLGSMNDFGRMMSLDERPWLDVALQLAKAPCSPIGMESPHDATLARFASRSLRLVRGGRDGAPSDIQ